MTNTQIPDKRDDSEIQIQVKISQEDKDTDSHKMERNEPKPQNNIITLPGKHLRRVREENQMSVKQVADSLHLEVRIIKMLEKDDYKSGIPPIFIKGYIRNYANLMDISPDPLIAAFDDATETKEQGYSTRQSQFKPKKQVKSNDLLPKLVTLVVLLSLIIFIALWQFSPPDEEIVSEKNQFQEINTPSLTHPQISRENDKTSDIANQTQTIATLPKEIETVIEQPMVTTVEQPMVTPVEQPMVTTPVEQPIVTPVEVIPPVVPIQPKDNKIYMNFKGTVWMRVTDSTDKKLYQGTGIDGKSLTLEGTPPYRVRIGNYNDVDIKYQGNVKDVKNYPKYDNKNKTFLIGG